MREKFWSYWWCQGLNEKNYAISTLVVTTLPGIVVKKNMWKTLGSLILGSINDKLSLWFWVLVFLRLAINAK